MATARPAWRTGVPDWGIKASVKAWLIKHWLDESVQELSAYLKIGSVREARFTCRVAYAVNRELWLHDIIWYDDYLEIEEMLNRIYNVLLEV